MNAHLHPLFQNINELFIQRTQVADLPSAWVDASAELTIGSLWIADIEGRVSVHREGAYLVIDDMEISGQRHGRKAVIGIGKDVAGRLRELTPSQQQEHLCACAFHDLIDDPRFIERAEEALAEAEREWRIG